MAIFNTSRALFWNERGDYAGRKGFDASKKTFEFKEGAYNIDVQNASVLEVNVFPFPFNWLWRRDVYFYQISHSNPIKLDKKNEPIMNPELFNINLKTKVAKELNDLANPGLLRFLTLKNVIIAGVLVAVYFYLKSIHKI